MTSKLTAEDMAPLEAWDDRLLTPQEFDARIRVPMSDFEREDFEGLVTWFTRRYATAGERMKYSRSRARRRFHRTR